MEFEWETGKLLALGPGAIASWRSFSMLFFSIFGFLGTYLTGCSNFKLEFTANRSISGRTSSDIAIDDIMIEDEACISFILIRSHFKKVFYVRIGQILK